MPPPFSPDELQELKRIEVVFIRGIQILLVEINLWSSQFPCARYCKEAAIDLPV